MPSWDLDMQGWRPPREKIDQALPSFFAIAIGEVMDFPANIFLLPTQWDPIDAD